MSLWYILTLCVVAATICYVFWNYNKIKKMPEGTPEMVEMAGIIRSGANTFMKTEYKTIAIVVALLALVLSLFVERTSGITFLMGALMSSIVCVLGMRSATYANVRTANKARESMSIGETVKVALCGGSISGLSVQAFGLLGLVLVLIIFGNVDPGSTGRRPDHHPGGDQPHDHAYFHLQPGMLPGRHVQPGGRRKLHQGCGHLRGYSGQGPE